MRDGGVREESEEFGDEEGVWWVSGGVWRVGMEKNGCGEETVTEVEGLRMRGMEGDELKEVGGG